MCNCLKLVPCNLYLVPCNKKRNPFFRAYMSHWIKTRAISLFCHSFLLTLYGDNIWYTSKSIYTYIYIVLLFFVLYCIILYHTVSYNIILYHTVSYCIILYHTVSFINDSFLCDILYNFIIVFVSFFFC